DNEAEHNTSAAGLRSKRRAGLADNLMEAIQVQNAAEAVRADVRDDDQKHDFVVDRDPKGPHLYDVLESKKPEDHQDRDRDHAERPIDATHTIDVDDGEEQEEEARDNRAGRGHEARELGEVDAPGREEEKIPRRV